MKIKNILILCLSLILIFMFTSCKNDDTQTNVTEPHKEIEEPVVEIDNPNETLEIANSYLGEWSTPGGEFTYELKEGGQLIVTSSMGIDEDCHWEINDDILTFTFSDMGTISYNVSEDKLECTDDPEWYLIR